MSGQVKKKKKKKKKKKTDPYFGTIIIKAYKLVGSINYRRK